MSYDLSRIKSESDFVNMLIEMDDYIRAGILTQDKLPLGDLSDAIFEEVVRRKFNDKKQNIILGAFESIIKEINTKQMDAETLSVHMRQIIAYLV